MNELQQGIREEMQVLPTIDVKSEVTERVGFLVSFLEKHPFLNGFVLGISGGQDSTLTGKLAQLAIDEANKRNPHKEYVFIAVRLPYGNQQDEPDCQDALAFIKPSKSFAVNIKASVDASYQAVTKALGTPLGDFNKGNIKARHRMETQYSIAAANGCAVIGTDHSAEAITGFYTKFGDGGADLIPIFGLNKRQGRKILKYLGCPRHLFEKAPTADLEEDRPALPDEAALGVSYEAIDDYLEGKEVSSADALAIEGHYLKTNHKRHLPITIYDSWWK
ncbi:MAG: ammonia-dependent NAD(+) synthetase [Turicibacter sp.]|nr:ammonia-dependent NAD(+) synthetase [Turicibacter sp.]